MSSSNINTTNQHGQKLVYRRHFIEFMSMFDGVNYPIAHDFPAEAIHRITPDDVVTFLNVKAYGVAVPRRHDKPTLARSHKLQFYKTALSSFMLDGRRWDVDLKIGNPTKSKAVNDVIKRIKEFENNGNEGGNTRGNGGLKSGQMPTTGSVKTAADKIQEFKNEMAKKPQQVGGGGLNSIAPTASVPAASVAPANPVVPTPAATTPAAPAATSSAKQQVTKASTKNSASRTNNAKSAVAGVSAPGKSVAGLPAVRMLPAPTVNPVFAPMAFGPPGARLVNAGAVFAELDSIKERVEDLREMVLQSDRRQMRFMDGMNKIVRQIQMQHAMRPPGIPPPKSRVHKEPQPGDPGYQGDANLSKMPKDLRTLWREYQFGLDGNKPAKDFTPQERGHVKCIYCRRKVFWDAVQMLIAKGFTWETAVDRILTVYGSRHSVSKILHELRKDRLAKIDRLS
mmetsp:Transcript_28591/g.60599  ORF Transcript_28591/g.60599 Transcript_28591/m.60599 type:complete len:453 (+) Transcript_28591:105-1463(+)